MKSKSKDTKSLPKAPSKRPYVEFPKGETIVALQQMSKKIYPRWQFWRPRINYLYAATPHAIYEVEVSTVTLTQRWRNKIKVRHFTLTRQDKVTDLASTNSKPPQTHTKSAPKSTNDKEEK